jgi:hypothetical protein
MLHKVHIDYMLSTFKITLSQPWPYALIISRLRNMLTDTDSKKAEITVRKAENHLQQR